MTDAQQWTGQFVDGDIKLVEYLGGSPENAVFRTELADAENSRAAIRLISAQSATAEAQLSRWSAASKLWHPHLLRILRMGQCQVVNVNGGGAEMLYVVTEFAEENLSQILPTPALTAAETSEMLDPLLDALGFLHSQGFLHGDLKPSNIMAAGDQLKLSGDAICPIGQKPILYIPQVFPAPEASGSGLSPAADMWALGASLVEVLTQRPPALPGAKSVFPDNLPAPFAEIVRRCLRRNPEERPTVADVASLLHPAISHPAKAPTPNIPLTSEVATPAAAVQAPETLRRPAARVRTLTALAVLVVLLVAVGLSRRSQKPSDSITTATPAPQAPHSETIPAVGPPDLPAKSAPPQVLPSEPAPRSKQPKGEAAAPAKESPDDTQDSASAAEPTPGVVRKVLPAIPQRARNTITGKVKVKVKVQVAPSGEVTDAEFVSAGPSKYFANFVMAAAKQWQFSPSPSPHAWDLQFVLRRDGTQVISAPSR